jgi:hypothetical protein
VLPVLGALPDTLIIIVAGMGDKATAQEEVTGQRTSGLSFNNILHLHVDIHTRTHRKP